MRSPSRQHDIPLLFKYATAKTATAILASRSLRYSSPVLFNDPFDVPREFDLGFTFEELRTAIVKRFEDYLNGNGTPGTPASRKLLSVMRDRMNEKPVSVMLAELEVFVTVFVKQAFSDMKSSFQRDWDARIPGMRICCFSDTESSAAMWAHYCDQHGGAVLEFDSSDERDSVSLLAQPVIYQSSKPALPDVSVWARHTLGEAERDWDLYLNEYFFAKTPEWSYEREYRVSTHKNKTEEGLFSDYVFHAHDLRGVVLGAEMKAEDEARIRLIVRVKYPHAHLYRSRIDLKAMVIAKDLIEQGAT